MQAQLLALRERRTSFDRFAFETRPRWVALARYLLSRWKAPPCVGVEDLVQELLLACWHFVDEWDPDRGTSLERYVVWNATDKAKKWLHKERGAPHRRDNDRSRIHASLSALAPGWETRVSFWKPADQEAPIIRDQVREHLLASCSLADELLVRRFIQHKDVEEAADVIYQDPKLRLAFRFNCVDDARAEIRRAARDALRRTEHGN